KDDPRKNPTGAGAGTITALENLCTAVGECEEAPRVKSEPGPPMTLGGAARAGLRFIVWCKACGHQVEPDPAEQAQRYGAETTVPKRTRCLQSTYPSFKARVVPLLLQDRR